MPTAFSLMPALLLLAAAPLIEPNHLAANTLTNLQCRERMLTILDDSASHQPDPQQHRRTSASAGNQRVYTDFRCDAFWVFAGRQCGCQLQ